MPPHREGGSSDPVQVVWWSDSDFAPLLCGPPRGLKAPLSYTAPTPWPQVIGQGWALVQTRPLSLCLRTSKLWLRNGSGAGSKALEGWPPSPAGRGDASMRGRRRRCREPGRFLGRESPGGTWLWPWPLEAPLGLCPANHTPVRASLETMRQQMLLYTWANLSYIVSGNPKAPTYHCSLGILCTLPLVSKLSPSTRSTYSNRILFGSWRKVMIV